MIDTIIDERASEIASGLQEVAEYMEANGVVGVEVGIDGVWHKELIPCIYFDGEQDGRQVLELVQGFARERNLYASVLAWNLLDLDIEGHEPPKWLVVFRD